MERDHHFYSGSFSLFTFYIKITLSIHGMDSSINIGNADPYTFIGAVGKIPSYQDHFRLCHTDAAVFHPDMLSDSNSIGKPFRLNRNPFFSA